tara:strand:+ start:1477 stop:1731 length:255 start_codon:yes stop_codon:yes gene_type:complete
MIGLTIENIQDEKLKLTLLCQKVRGGCEARGEISKGQKDNGTMLYERQCTESQSDHSSKTNHELLIITSISIIFSPTMVSRHQH